MKRLALCLAVAGLLGCAGSASAASLPRLPTEMTGKAALQVRPAEVGFTGDGTGYLGGFNGHRSLRLTRSTPKDPFGAIKWTKWLTGRALGSGADWLNNGIPDDADGTFHPYTMAVLAFRPRHNVFTRMRVVYIKPCRYCADNTYTLLYKARYFHGDQYGPGYWQWFGA